MENTLERSRAEHVRRFSDDLGYQIISNHVRKTENVDCRKPMDGFANNAEYKSADLSG